MNRYIPAFPRPASTGNNYLTGEEGVVVDPQTGMSLRDYFAAAALQGYLAAHGDGAMFPDASEAAEAAFHYADAMLKARDGS